MTTQELPQLRRAQRESKRKLVFEATDKQIEALGVLDDLITTEMVYGGAAGGAKSFLGCAWLILSCHRYHESRWLLGRAVLKQLKQSTLLTFFDVCKKMQLKKGIDYSYNEQSGIIHFHFTGSEIYLKDLAHYPSDPEYDSLGSTEYTGGFIDEASQITEKAKNVVISRLRYKIDEYGVIPKLLMTCNPSKNFLYTEFYKPWKAGELPAGKSFIMAKVEDNPFLSDAYIKNLRTLDKNSQERLLKGNWEYDDDPSALIEFDAITDIFTNTADTPDPALKDNLGRAILDERPRYIVCDVARFGEDRTVITVWKGWECIKVFVYKKTSTTTVANLIKEKAKEFNVPASHIIVDEDGIGGGVKDQLYGIKGFIANTRAARGENYTNLKSQCTYFMSKKIMSREVAVRMQNPDMKQMLMSELEQWKAKDIDKDGKLAIVSKDDIKQAIGRSPDLADCIMMRGAFEFIPKPRLTFV